MKSWIMDVLRFLHHVSPALIAVVLGGFVLQIYLRTLAQLADCIDDAIRRLELTKENALEYWRLDCANSKQQRRAKVLEQEIKAGCISLSRELDFIEDSMCVKKKFVSKIDMGIYEFHSSCMGKTFEMLGREADSRKYFKIISTASDLKGYFRKAKIGFSILLYFRSKIGMNRRKK